MKIRLPFLSDFQWNMQKMGPNYYDNPNTIKEIYP